MLKMQNNGKGWLSFEEELGFQSFHIKVNI